MGSENAKAVAMETLDTIRKGLKVNKGKIIKKHGYSDSMSKKPKKVYETKACKEVIEPVVKRMERIRDKVIKALENRNLDKEKTAELNNLLKNLNHDIQLLNGGETERSIINVVNYGDNNTSQLSTKTTPVGISKSKSKIQDSSME